MIPANYLKKTFSKGKIIPYLLKEKDPANPRIRELAAYYERMLGKRYSDFDSEKPIMIMEDFKLARSVESCFSRYYFWKSPEFRDALSSKEISILAERKIESYQDLRLFVYSLAKDGFASEKEKIIRKAEKELCISGLNELLWLDYEQSRILIKIREFDLKDFIAYYNKEVLETMFNNTERVRITSPAFDKRLIFLCREFGLVYEIERDAGFTYHVSGPVEMFGKPGKYGYRILPFISRMMTILHDWQLSAEVFIKQKYIFEIDKEMMAGLLFEDTFEPGDEFDSFPEQMFFESFLSNYSGWEIEREPEPIFKKDLVFVPDFAIRRGESYVYVEVVGFWTESYKARKIEKLKRLKRYNVSLILLVEKKYEKDVKKAFEETGFDVIFYDFSKKPSAVPVLQLLERKYSDYESRALKAKDAGHGIEKLLKRGFATYSELSELLGFYTQEELEKYLKDYKLDERILIDGAGIFTKEILIIIKELIISSLGKSRQHLEDSLMQGGLPAEVADHVLSYFNYTVKWKNLTENEVQRC
jgi:predicted nuclease of restriction endonuclease-like RecB superfamily